MDNNLLLFIIGGALVYWYWIKVHKDDEGRIEDLSVNVDAVLEVLETFKASSSTSLQDGFTEASIQKQLFSYLNSHFVHVNREQGVEGINGLKIDFDIGRGKVGLEVKLARSLFKAGGIHRLSGQLVDYSKNKYSDKNLIIAVFGTKDEGAQRVYLSDIQEKIEAQRAKYIFLKVK